MPFRREHPDTINHPEINEFIAVCDDVRAGDFVHADEVLSSELLAFAKNLLILRWDEARKDFLYRLYGTELAEAHEIELTGKYLSEAEHGEAEADFAEAHLEVLRDRKRMYMGGPMHWRGKSHRIWNQVTMPLLRDDKILETLTFATFE